MARSKRETLPKSLKFEVLEGINNNFVLYKTSFSKKDFSRKVKDRRGGMKTEYSISVYKESVDGHSLTFFIRHRHKARIKDLCVFFSKNKSYFLGTNLIGTNVLFESMEM